jgi:hypothetical protein
MPQKKDWLIAKEKDIESKASSDRCSGTTQDESVFLRGMRPFFAFAMK